MQLLALNESRRILDDHHPPPVIHDCVALLDTRLHDDLHDGARSDVPGLTTQLSRRRTLGPVYAHVMTCAPSSTERGAALVPRSVCEAEHSALYTKFQSCSLCRAKERCVPRLCLGCQAETVELVAVTYTDKKARIVQLLGLARTWHQPGQMATTEMLRDVMYGSSAWILTPNRTAALLRQYSSSTEWTSLESMGHCATLCCCLTR